MRGHLGTEIEKYLSTERWGCGCIGIVDSGRKLESVLKSNTNAQGLSFLSHLLCSAWGTLRQDCWSFPSVSNRESQYTPPRFKNMFGRGIRRNSALRSRILFARTEVMHTPRSDIPLLFDLKNVYQIRTEKC